MERKLPLVIVDGSNFWHSLKAVLRREPNADDIARLREYLTDNQPITPVSTNFTRYYLPEPLGGNGAKGFRENLKVFGWLVLTRPLLAIRIKGEIRKWKGNLDLFMGWDIRGFLLDNLQRVEKIVLVTGDGDFVFLVEEAHKLNLSVTVLASRGLFSSSLRSASDRIIPLERVINEIKRDNTSAAVREADNNRSAALGSRGVEI